MCENDLAHTFGGNMNLDILTFTNLLEKNLNTYEHQDKSEVSSSISQVFSFTQGHSGLHGSLSWAGSHLAPEWTG